MRFYTRRMLRLYPLLVAVVVVTFVPAVVDHIENPVPDSLSALFYVTNFWRQLQHTNYINLVINTWSLGVEEQFYLCWPIILIIALRRQWSLTKVLIALMLGTFLLTGATYHAHLPFVSVLARLPWAPGPELAAGSLLAVLQTKPEVIKWVRRGVGWPVALASIALIFVVTFHGMYRWWSFGGVTVIVWPLIAYLALVPEGWLSKALCFRPAVWLGERSYAIYLIQIPVVVLLSRSVHSWYGELAYRPATHTGTGRALVAVRRATLPADEGAVRDPRAWRFQLVTLRRAWRSPRRPIRKYRPLCRGNTTRRARKARYTSSPTRRPIRVFCQEERQSVSKHTHQPSTSGACPHPSEGFLVALFTTVPSVARSRAFCS